MSAAELALVEVVKREYARRWYDCFGNRILANGNLRAALKTLRQFRGAR